MPPSRLYRCALTVQLACYWLLSATAALGQIEFGQATVLENQAPPAGEPITTSQPEELPVPLAQQLFPAQTAGSLPHGSFVDDSKYWLGGRARGYYLNDQRIEFTGMEATFAVEGVLEGGLSQRIGDWETTLNAQLFLNQPFDRNILEDTPTRRAFAPNFNIDPLQISQLSIGMRRGDLYAALGRFVTPFGRFYFPNYRNNFDDSPFIRSNAIGFRETGLLLQWDPNFWMFQAALTNGGFGQDTNSSKALVARAGIDTPWAALGTSIKVQDGIGSETQKVFNNHIGADGMIRFGNWTLSGEVIYDEYGLRRPGTALNDIFWGRSLYFRDLNKGFAVPITGWGYYANLGYEGPCWSITLNYGDFYPGQIGDPRQDLPIHRWLTKASRYWTPQLETYAVLLLENKRIDDLDSTPRKGIYVIFGTQYSF
jgi:hypothetical protein